jgi:hypothetical protein
MLNSEIQFLDVTQIRILTINASTVSTHKVSSLAEHKGEFYHSFIMSKNQTEKWQILSVLRCYGHSFNAWLYMLMLTKVLMLLDLNRKLNNILSRVD